MALYIEHIFLSNTKFTFSEQDTKEAYKIFQAPPRVLLALEHINWFTVTTVVCFQPLHRTLCCISWMAGENNPSVYLCFI